MPATQFGKKIDIKTAQDCMNMYNQIMDTTTTTLTTLRPVQTATATAASVTVDLTAMNQYFSKIKQNAFIFDRELVTRFFDEKDKNGNTADFLVVLMGAQPDNDSTDPSIKKGDPTVILVGCKRKGESKAFDTEENIALESMALDEPASEHPPVEVIPDFPPAGAPAFAPAMFTLI